MRPECVQQRRGKGLAIIHMCLTCGFTRSNRIAGDPEQGDDIDAVIAVMNATDFWRRRP
jgi:RNHCP domain-containing protein